MKLRLKKGKNNKMITCLYKLCKYLQCLILNSFNPELQIKGPESAVRNILKDLLTKLKGFEFVTSLILEFKKDRK